MVCLVEYIYIYIFVRRLHYRRSNPLSGGKREGGVLKEGPETGLYGNHYTTIPTLLTLCTSQVASAVEYIDTYRSTRRHLQLYIYILIHCDGYWAVAVIQ